MSFVYLHGRRATLETRPALRTHRFKSASLLDSQLATLEEPGEDERCVWAHIDLPVDRLVDGVVRNLSRNGGS